MQEFARQSDLRCACRAIGRWGRLFAVVACCLAVRTPVTPASETIWGYARSDVRVLLDVAQPSRHGPIQVDAIARYLTDRCVATAGQVWRVQVETASIPPAWFVDSEPEVTRSWLADFDSVNDQGGLDKLILLRLSFDQGACNVEAREFDLMTRRWGEKLQATTRQSSGRSRLAFAMLHKAISPVATFRLDPENRDRVVLDPRGALLTPMASDFRRIEVGDVLLPIIRKNDREGNPVPGGVFQVPWTYLIVDDPPADAAAATTEPPLDGDALQCAVHSGVRRPFGVRRRGRVEQLAIVARPQHESSSIRFVSRMDENRPLPGCRVLERESDDSFQLIATSNRDGRFEIERSEAPIRTLWIKSGSLIVAKTPIVVGLEREFVLPLPDDESRLEIEGELTALRNELFDTVAMRQVLAARFHNQLAKREFDAARALLEQIEALPTRARYSERIQRQERTATADDPRTRARIEKLFSDTKVVLGRFLDQREVGELHDRLNAAMREAPNADAAPLSATAH